MKSLKVVKIITFLIVISLALMGCSTSTSSSTNKSNNTASNNSTSANNTNTIDTSHMMVNNSSNTQNSQDIPKNVIKTSVSEAEEIPHLFYQYLNNKQYDKVTSVLGPLLKFEGDSSQRKYLENIENTTFLDFKDISSDGGYNLDSTQQNYFAVKVYYAVLSMKVKDKNLVPALVNTQYRKMVVVKVTKNSSWVLDSDESTPPIN